MPYVNAYDALHLSRRVSKSDLDFERTFRIQSWTEISHLNIWQFDDSIVKNEY